MGRKKSAETQTKRIRISTQTQTPVVTKRERCKRSKQSTSAETQTASKYDAPPPQKSSLTSNSTGTSTIPFQSSDYGLGLEELASHTQTQTDPNPFFGIHKYSIFHELDVLFADNEVSEMLSLATAETQTVLQSTNGVNDEDASLDAVLEELDGYLETVDTETQTGSLFDKFLSE
jgi:hypothetical protein